MTLPCVSPAPTIGSAYATEAPRDESQYCELRGLLPRLPPREERAGVRRAALTPMKSPHPSPLPVRRGEGEATAPFLASNSTAVSRWGRSYRQSSGLFIPLPPWRSTCV